MFFMYSETAETNFHNIEIILALQHLMVPSTVVLKNHKRYKATIEKSKMWLFKLIDCKTLIEAHLTLAKTDRQIKQLEEYPIIFGIGECNTSVSEFILAFHDIRYKFYTIIEAIDAAFKCYMIFRVNFPPEHKRLWVLLNALFYKVDSDLVVVTPAIASVIGSFKI